MQSSGCLQTAAGTPMAQARRARARARKCGVLRCALVGQHPASAATAATLCSAKTLWPN